MAKQLARSTHAPWNNTHVNVSTHTRIDSLLSHELASQLPRECCVALQFLRQPIHPACLRDEWVGLRHIHRELTTCHSLQLHDTTAHILKRVELICAQKLRRMQCLGAKLQGRELC